MKQEQFIQLRANLGLSRADFARVFGVTEKTVYNWEAKIIPRGRSFELMKCFLNARTDKHLWAKVIEMAHAGQYDDLARLVVSANIGTQSLTSKDSRIGSSKEGNLILVAVSQSAFIGAEISRAQIQSIFTNLHELSDGLYRSELQRSIKDWMDRCPEYSMSGGFGHRILHGHSLSDGFQVYKSSGLKGLRDWTSEVSFDALSPDGLPLPFAREIWQGSGITVHQATRWLTFNVMDAVVAGAATLGLLRSEEQLPSESALNAVTQLVFGVMKANPLLLVSGTLALSGALVAFLQGQEVTKIDLSMYGFRAFTSEMDSWQAFEPEVHLSNL